MIFELLNEAIVSRDKLNALAQPQCSLKLAKEYEHVRPFGYEIQICPSGAEIIAVV